MNMGDVLPFWITSPAPGSIAAIWSKPRYLTHEIGAITRYLLACLSRTGVIYNFRTYSEVDTGKAAKGVDAGLFYHAK